MTPIVRPFEELRFVVVGAYVLDCLISTPRLPGWGQDLRAEAMRTVPGGKALNQAVTLARLGTQVNALGVVGSDPVGRAIVSALARQHVDVTTMTNLDGVPTPICLVFTRPDGENAVVWHVPDEFAVTSDHVQHATDAIAAADTVLVTFENVAAVTETISIAKKHRTRVVVNPAPLLTDPAAVANVPWHDVDVLVPNEAEARALLTGQDESAAPAVELPEALASALGAPFVCVTLAENGCVLRADRTTTVYPAPPVEVTDTTAASDASIAVLAAYLTAGHRPAVAVHQAQAAAALTVSRPGAYESLPTPHELHQQARTLPKLPF